MSGRVVHFEVPYDDAERAHGFYREVFGWQIQPIPSSSTTSPPPGRRTNRDARVSPGTWAAACPCAAPS